MRNRLIWLTIIFSIIIILLCGGFYLIKIGNNSKDAQSEQIVALNEINQLARLGQVDKMSEKIEQVQNEIKAMEEASWEGAHSNHQLIRVILGMGGICIAFLIIVFGYVYIAILKPFDSMKIYAQRISMGDFDLTLDYERSNYFGEFTWAFDSMRREITKARACEREAIENNKTIIATLSHDIKTPIASIRAYGEGLEANLDISPEKRSRYLQVLMRKCDELSRLTDDLLLHSLSDLDKLKMSFEEIEICEFVEKAVSEISADQNDIFFRKGDFSAKVMADPNRLMQIIENLINNARKYAKSNIDIFLTSHEDMVKIHFRDYGRGIFDEDRPFIFNKFYRGKNCSNEQGSGLGLYIVRYIVRQMEGDIFLQNLIDGLEAVISLPIIS